MRISTSSIYNANVANLDNLQAQIAQTQQQIATQRRILDPSMDPVGAARATELTLSIATNTQFAANNTAATNTLSLSEGILTGVTSLLQDAQTTVLSVGNPLVTDANRKAAALDLQSRLQNLLGFANSTDGAGNYLYSGAQGSVQPFANTAGGVVYQGDDVQRKMQVAASRQISSTDSGADIFMRIRNGNGTFQAAPVAGNGGTGIISQGVVTNSAMYSGNSYQVSFTVVAGVTTFSVNDTTSGAPVPVAGMTNVPYVSGQAISFNGIQFDIKGAPADGDRFNVTPSSNQSIFDTLGKLITALNTPLAGASAAAVAANTQAMNDATSALNQDLNNVLGVRATIGSRLNELTALQTTGTELDLQYRKTLSAIQDTDLTKAITDLSQQNLILQAAQQSFAAISKLSLFNFL